MVKICGFDLGEYDEKILYACAVDKTHDKYTYSMHDMKGVMGQMIEEKEPGFAESPKFATYRGYYDQVVNWRASGQPYIQDLKERVEKDLGELRQRGSELYRRCKDVAPETVVRAPKVRAPKVQGPGPAAFRDPGNRNNLKIVGIVLDDDHLSDIYAAANLIFTSSGEQCTVEVIKAMIVVMLSITGKNNFKVQSVKDYVNVFRQDKDHWVTKLVASWMTGDRPRLHGERAIKLLGKTKHKGAYKLVLPS